MTERQTTEQEESQSWDFDNPVKSGPVKNRRTVVSVSFPSSDFQIVAAAAGEAGLNTSRFIREAAIAKASPVYTEVMVSWGGGTTSVVLLLGPSCSTLGEATYEPHIEYTGEGAHVYAPA